MKDEKMERLAPGKDWNAKGRSLNAQGEMLRPQVPAQSRTAHSNRNIAGATDIMDFCLIFLCERSPVAQSDVELCVVMTVSFNHQFDTT